MTNPQAHNGNNDKKQTTPPPAPPTNKPATAAAPADEAKKTRSPRKVYVVVGEVKEFNSKVEAEKFLNTPEAPAAFSVIVGAKIEKKQKVSLR